MIMEHTPVIQILEKHDCRKQHIVTLPSALPLPPLHPSSIRVKSSLISLTTNNLTYARLGHLFGWWDVHPLPPSTPPEFRDSTAYGRVSAWGYADVVESNVDAIGVGSQVFGYLPIGTLPVDLQISAAGAPGHYVETSAHRQHLWAIYNRYVTFASVSASDVSRESRGWDSLMQGLFETSFNLNRRAFAWDTSHIVHPLGEDGEWTEQDAHVGGAVLLLFAASGKTALSFAHQLRKARPQDSQPGAIIGVTSEGSRSFVEGTGFYDHVALYDANPGDVLSAHAPNSKTKLVLCDFGGRANSASRWCEALRLLYQNTVYIGIGGEATALDQETLKQNAMEAARLGRVQANASGLRSRAMETIGEEAYFKDFLQSWQAFKEEGGIPGLKLEFRNGMEAVAAGWDKLCHGGVGPDKGLLYQI